jgi:hypothetical protein
MATNYPSVLFGSSTMPGNYAYSEVVYKGQSWVENVRGRLPLSDTLFFTPSNSLSLKYTSVSGGDWTSNIYFSDRNQGYQPKANEFLSFRLYIHQIKQIQDLPILALQQQNNESISVPISAYLDSLTTNEWVHVKIPLSEFAGLSLQSPIIGLSIRQGLAHSAHTAHILLDQIEFLTPSHQTEGHLTFPAVLSTVQAYERHVDLTWQLPLTTSIRYIKIYRSQDQQHFEPIALRPIFATKYTDVVPLSTGQYFYRITWVDADYQESPPSKDMEAKMQSASDDQLLDFIQAAHIHYFGDHIEINSGMHKAVQGFQEATISTGETGLSLLVQVVGVEKGLVPKALFTKRVMDILKFLKKSQEYHGVFPSYLNGRTGQGIFAANEGPTVSLRNTSSLLQGLLVASAYLNQKEITIQVDALYRRVRWDKFVKAEEGGVVLYDHWSPMTNFTHARPMGGYNADWFTYLLALAAPQNAIRSEAYFKGYGMLRSLPAVSGSDKMNSEGNTLGTASFVSNEKEVATTFSPLSIVKDTLLYGLPVRIGRIDQSLLIPYEMFLAFDPRGKQDTFANYYTNNILLTEAYRRRDHERNIGNFSLDIWGVENGDSTLRSSTRIVPAISASSYAYAPQVAIKSIRRMYQDYGNALFSEYGLRTWVNFRENAVSEQYTPLNQAMVVLMIENARTGLIWDTFMKLDPVKKFTQTYFKESNQ